MPRNDAQLYSGLVAPVRRERIEKELHETKKDARAELVLDEIAKLKASAMDISKVVLDDSQTDEVKLRSIERMKERYQDLSTLERRMQKLLGVRTKA